MANGAVPEIAEKWGFSETAIRKSVIAALSGSATNEEAARVFFGEIAKPTNFVDVYFERYSGTKDLPAWMSGLGLRLYEGISKLRQISTSLPQSRVLVEQAKDQLGQRLGGFSKGLVRGAREAASEFGLTDEVLARFEFDESLRREVPSCRIVDDTIVPYVLATGIEKDGPKPEKSIGGDLIHVLYISHCDLWRGDRRFAHLVKQSLPEFGMRVVPRLSELPQRIREHNQLQKA